MSRHGACVVGLLLGLVGGCAGVDGERAPSLFKSAYRLPDGYVQMDVALLERPAGDLFLNKELWSYTDETVVGMDARPRLDKNGFRVGQIVGMPPGEFQRLLTSPRACLNPRRCFLPTGAAADKSPPFRLLLGPIEPDARFVLKPSGPEIELSFDDVQHQLEVVPALTTDGVRLAFTPRLQHGEPIRTVVVPPDQTDFVLQVEKPSQTFQELRFEVTLAANEYLVIGCRDDQPQSLGYEAFVSESGRPPMQRLLVIRATRANARREDDTPTLEDLARAAVSPPLAAQATRSAVRANGP
jgi:hypothetical protein